MQLFSIGLYNLNLDGSLTLSSSGFPIATYNQDAILGTAAVFTGWTYAQTTNPPVFNPPADWRDPMVNVASRHSPGSKTILNGVLIPAGQTAAQDLQTHARHHLQSSECRTVLLPATDPAAGDE